MAVPTSSIATPRPELAQSFREFDAAMQEANLIGTQILTPIPVGVFASQFGVIPLEATLPNAQGRTARAPGGGYSRGDYEWTSKSYTTKENGWEEPVDDREAAMYANFFDAEQLAADRAHTVVLTEFEIRIAAALYNTTTFAGQITTLTNEWDDAALSTPFEDIRVAKRAVWSRTGLWPNTLIINEHQRQNLVAAASIIEKIKYSGIDDPKPANITLNALAAALDIDRILVGNTAKNTGIPGAAAVIGSIWSDEFAMVAVVESSRDFRKPCIGRTFHWAGDGSELLGHVESYRDETVRADIIRVRHDTDEVIIYPEAAQLLENVTT